MKTPPSAPKDVLQHLERLGVSRESRAGLEVFLDLLFQWQDRINLVAPSTLPDVWLRHVIDSLQLLPLLPDAATHIADLGSGSGFPGMPLAIASGRHVDFYESNNKKAAFLREALRLTKAPGNIHPQRLGPGFKLSGSMPVQVVTARALAPFNELLGLAEPFLQAGAIGLFHKGQDVDAELTQAAKSWKIKYETHVSSTDSKAVVLLVKEVTRV